jgi:hypothetical protein
MSDFSTPPWEKDEKKDLCPECGGFIIDEFCEDCGAEQIHYSLSDWEYLQDEE